MECFTVTCYSGRELELESLVSQPVHPTPFLHRRHDQYFETREGQSKLTSFHNYSRDLDMLNVMPGATLI
jgi:hypothetical protein